jgi:translation initiation factor 2 subunit 1
MVESEELDNARFVDDDTNLECRFYENQYPDLEEVVMVNVMEIGEMGAYVTLLEYDGIQGMILLSELTRRRIRSINKLIRVNRNEVVMVLRVDQEKGYIDLSKRRVSPEDVVKCEDRYNKAKTVHSVLRHLAAIFNIDVQTLYTDIGWPLYRKYGHAYDAFKIALSDSDDDIFEGIQITDEIKTALLSFVKRRLAPQPVKIRSDIEVTCFTYEGIDAIKDALTQGENAGHADAPVHIKLIAPPMYVMTCMTLDKELGIESLKKATVTITEAIKAKGGSLDVKMAPKAVTLREDSDLESMLARLAQELEDVDGDTPEDV